MEDKKRARILLVAFLSVVIIAVLVMVLITVIPYRFTFNANDIADITIKNIQIYEYDDNGLLKEPIATKDVTVQSESFEEFVNDLKEIKYKNYRFRSGMRQKTCSLEWIEITLKSGKVIQVYLHIILVNGKTKDYANYSPKFYQLIEKYSQT